MFFVYCGYVSPDHYDSSESPTYELHSFKDEESLLQFKKQFEENVHSECDNIIFRIFSGKEVFLKPVNVVTEWKLEE